MLFSVQEDRSQTSILSRLPARTTSLSSFAYSLKAAGIRTPPCLSSCRSAAALTRNLVIVRALLLVSGSVELLEKPGSVGKLYGGQEIRFVDREIQLRGDNIFIEYINDPKETAAAFDDGWFRTGDLGRMDEDGYLYITGRIKNLIYCSNGEKICPEQIEARSDRIPGVKASLVSMRENSLGAKLLTCEIFADRGADRDGIRAAVERINAGLPEYSRIRQVLFRDEDFPRTPSMKIRRGANG